MEKNKLDTKDIILKSIPFNATIKFTNNKNSIIKIEKNIFETKIKIDRIFECVETQILNDLIYYIRNHSNKEDNKLAIVKERIKNYYIENKVKHKKNKNEKPKIIKNTFIYHNIFEYFKQIIKELEKKYQLNFNEIIIKWGRKSKRSHRGIRKRSIRLGLFNRENNIISINPKLDNKNFPDFFIKSIIYHEIAHYIYYKKNPQYKSIYHGYDFKEILKDIDPFYFKSKEWEKLNKKLIFY